MRIQRFGDDPGSLRLGFPAKETIKPRLVSPQAHEFKVRISDP